MKTIIYSLCQLAQLRFSKSGLSAIKSMRLTPVGGVVAGGYRVTASQKCLTLKPGVKPGSQPG